MASTTLTSAQLGAFCEGMALMQEAGITLPEAAYLLAQGCAEGSAERQALDGLYGPLAQGSSLAEAMKLTGAFPVYAARMVRNGERTGRLEATLRSLARFYDEQGRLFARVRANVAYPCALLCVMSVVLALCVVGVLPVFAEVYENVAGGLSAASSGFVAVGMAIGWAALAVTLVLTALALFVYASSRSEKGRERLLDLGERVPGLRRPLYEVALSRFVSALAVYTASGSHADEAMAAAAAGVEHRVLIERVNAAYEAMVQPVRPLGLAAALSQHGVIDEVSSRMLEFGARSGGADEALAKLAENLFEEGIGRFDRVIDMVEPALIALLTISIGATLVVVMLPLVGILGAIG